MNIDMGSFSPLSPCGEKSFLISFEGIDGSGKTTQINPLAKWLEEEKSYKVKVLQEPGSTEIGLKLRELILLRREKPLLPTTQLFLFLAARSELIDKEIRPFLANPRHIVLLDRFIDSTLVYQGIVQGIGVENVLQAHAVPPLNILPHKSFYLKISAETSLSRISHKEKDCFEEQGSQFMKDLASSYTQMATLFSERFSTLDSERDPEEVQKELRQEIEDLIQ